MDVKNAFLHGDLSKEIFMEQPLGFVTNSKPVCRLQRSLYGLKQAPQDWYAKIDNFFLRLGFKHCEFDHSLYLLHTHGNTLIIVVYVDNHVITGNKNDLILRLKKQLVDSFDMTKLGIQHYFLGLQLLPLSDGLFISQSKYVMDILTHFKMVDRKPCATPFQSRVKLRKNCLTPKVDATL